MMLMVFTIHIIVAILSVVISGAGLLKPNSKILICGYVLVIATLLSGAALAITTSASLAHVCISGSIFVLVSSVALFATRKKLLAITQS